MDIDEFLDKEVPAKKEGSGAVFTAQQPPEPKDAQPSGFPDAPSKAGNIGALEKNYLELWDKVSKDKFSWSSGLYEGIARTGDEIKKQIGLMASGLDGEKAGIKRLIISAKNALQSKNYNEALKLYSEIVSRRDNIPDAFFEEKKELNREILPFYAELAGKIDAKFAEDFGYSAAKADSLVRGSFSSLGKNDTANAKNLYEQALETYKSLPQGFLAQKIQLGSNLIALYKELSIIMQIEALQQQLSRRMAVPSPAANDGSARPLPGIERHKQEIHGLKKHAAISSLRNISEGHSSKDLLDRMISRRLEKANESMGKGLYPDVKKNIESVLRLDPQNKDAKIMLKKIPA